MRRWIEQLNGTQRMGLGAIYWFAISCVLLFLLVASSFFQEETWSIVSAVGQLASGAFTLAGLVVAAYIAWRTYEAANISANVAKSALEKDRAWLINDSATASASVLDLPEGGQKITAIKFHIPIVNFGNTPALDVKIQFFVGFRDDFHLEEIQWQETGVYRNLAVMGPSQTIDFHDSIPKADLRYLLHNGARKYLRLKIRYKHIFSQKDCDLDVSYVVHIKPGPPMRIILSPKSDSIAT